MTLKIDRAKPPELTLRKLANKQWDVDAERSDARALAVTEIDFRKVIFEPVEFTTKPPKLRERILELALLRRRILLDVQVGFTLYEEAQHETLEMLRLNRGVTKFDLPGTILTAPDGESCIMRFHYLKGTWNYMFWDERWSTDVPSALLRVSAWGAQGHRKMQKE